MASWDSFDKIEGSFLKIKKILGYAKVQLYYRALYDTPNFASYQLCINLEDLIPLKLIQKQKIEFRFILIPKVWSIDKPNIDVRDMSDGDIYDLFADKIEKAIRNYEEKGVSLTTLYNWIKEQNEDVKI